MHTPWHGCMTCLKPNMGFIEEEREGSCTAPALAALPYVQKQWLAWHASLLMNLSHSPSSLQATNYTLNILTC